MKTQLIMLETPIIVSDEVINKGDWTITNITFREDGTDEFEISICDKDVPIKPNRWRKKIIAGIEGLPSIDWNGLEEEFGWVDINKLAKELDKTKYRNFKREYTLKETYEGIEDGFIEGFKKAQSLNEKKFSLEEAKLIWFAGQKYWETSRDSITFDELVERRKELLQSQPKVFDIEVQMEYWKESTIYDQPDKSLDNPKPKITNNSIKIIKKLN